MSRRRYIATDISLDPAVQQLIADYGEFAGLLYTWMLPHADDNATITGEPQKLLYMVVPGLRNRTAEDVEQAVAGMEACGLLTWDRAERLVRFPVSSFYRYQSYVKQDSRRSAGGSGESGTVPENTGEPREAAPSAENPRGTPPNTEERRSRSPSRSPSGDSCAEGAGASARPPQPDTFAASARWVTERLGLTALPPGDWPVLTAQLAAVSGSAVSYQRVIEAVLAARGRARPKSIRYFDHAFASFAETHTLPAGDPRASPPEGERWHGESAAAADYAKLFAPKREEGPDHDKPRPAP